MDFGSIGKVFEVFREMGLDFGEILSVFTSKNPGKILAKVFPPILVRVEPFLTLARTHLSEEYGQDVMLSIHAWDIPDHEGNMKTVEAVSAFYMDAEKGIVILETKPFTELVTYIVDKSEKVQQKALPLPESEPLQLPEHEPLQLQKDN